MNRELTQAVGSLFVAVGLLAASCASHDSHAQVQSIESQRTAIVGRVIAKPKTGGAPEQVIERIRARFPTGPSVKLFRVMTDGALVLEFSDLANADELAALIGQLKETGWFEYVEPDSMLGIRKQRL